MKIVLCELSQCYLACNMLMDEILHTIEKHHWHFLGRHNCDGMSNRFWESGGGNRTIAKEASQHRGGGEV